MINGTNKFLQFQEVQPSARTRENTARCIAHVPGMCALITRTYVPSCKGCVLQLEVQTCL